MKKIIYVDMDNVLVDFQSGIDCLSEETKKEYEGRLDEVPNIFSFMKPVEGAVEAVELLSSVYDMYILSTAPWKNPSAWTHKAEWVQNYFGAEKYNVFYKRLIISHHKNLNRGDYLIDDRTKNGAAGFEGELIQFGTEKFPNWEAVTEYLTGWNILTKYEFWYSDAERKSSKRGNDRLSSREFEIIINPDKDSLYIRLTEFLKSIESWYTLSTSTSVLKSLFNVKQDRELLLIIKEIFRNIDGYQNFELMLYDNRINVTTNAGGY
ncbi:MAG: hypothetical protein LBU83_02435 [Bacteroidales bacterium]|jgi:5'(3')-deoxyribonucleotidase|nr:hypothetical protein [Bacteroidales bacterium]